MVFNSFFSSKKAQGLPIYAITIMIIGIIVLAIVLFFLFGIFSKGTSQTNDMFTVQQGFISNASETLDAFSTKAKASVDLKGLEQSHPAMNWRPIYV